MVPKRNRTSGGRRADRNSRPRAGPDRRGSGRGGPGRGGPGRGGPGRGGPRRRGSLERMSRNKPRARVFKRSDSEESRRRGSFDDSPRRRSGSGSRGGGFDFYPKRPRLGPKPGKGSWERPWGGQSKKSYEKYDKKFWREPPDPNKKKRIPRDQDENFSDDFDGSPKLNKKKKKQILGGKKKRGSGSSGSDMTPDPTQSELEAAYASYEENEGLLEERTRIGLSKQLTPQEMLREIRDRDYKELMANRQQKDVKALKSADEYKSGDDSSYVSDEEGTSDVGSEDDFRESDYEEDLKEEHSKEEGSKKIEKNDQHLKHPKEIENIYKKPNTKQKVEEKEWVDFLEKEVYKIDKKSKEENKGKDEQNEKEDSEIQNELQKAKDIGRIQEAEYKRKRLATLDNRWKWFHKIVKDCTDGNIMIPKELPAEAEEVEEEENDDEGNIDQDENVEEEETEEESSIQQIGGEMKESTNEGDEKYGTRETLETITDKKTNLQDITYTEALKFFSEKTYSDPETETPSQQELGISTMPISSQSSEDQTAAPSLQKLDENELEQSSTATSGPIFSENIYRELTVPEDRPQTNETLQEDWSTFLSTYEQCTGSTLDLPEELPDEAEETETSISGDETESDTDDESQITSPPCETIESPEEEHPSPVDQSASLIQTEDVSAKREQSQDQETVEFPGFAEQFRREEKAKDDDTNKCMYEKYKIEETAEEFREEHPDLFLPDPEDSPNKRATLKWHQFKALWNRFVEVATTDPSKAFYEFDKIAAAKEKAVKEGFDVADLLDLKNVPEDKEPQTEYEKTERQLRAHWRKIMKFGAEDPQRELTKTLRENKELDYNSEDDISPETEASLRAVVKLCDQPERFDMDKYEATLSKEEIDSLMTGEGMKYDKRHNPKADENIKNARDAKRGEMAKKMWEYFVNLMRERHEKALEEFLSDQPQSTTLEDTPGNIKDLWEKYINQTNKVQDVDSDKGNVEEGMDYLFAPATPVRRPPTLEEEDGQAHIPPNEKRSYAFSSLKENLQKLSKGEFNAEPQEADGTYGRTRSMPQQRREDVEATDKQLVDFHYRRQFPENKSESNIYQNVGYNSLPPQQQHPYNPKVYSYNSRGTSYQRNEYPVSSRGYRNEQILDNKSQAWQYSPEVDQISSSPFGTNRQSTTYERNGEQIAAGSSKLNWQRTPRSLDQNISLSNLDSRIPLGEGIQQNQDYNASMSQVPTYSQQNVPFPSRSGQGWEQTEQGFMEQQNQIRSIKTMQSGSRPFQTNWSQRPNQSNYNQRQRYTVGPQYDQSGAYYGVGTQDENCVPNTIESGGFKRQSREFDQQTPLN